MNTKPSEMLLTLKDGKLCIKADNVCLAVGLGMLEEARMMLEIAGRRGHDENRASIKTSPISVIHPGYQ